MGEKEYVIRVSFKKNERELKLYDDIKKACDIMGDSAWMKMAAIEKLERDNGANNTVAPNTPKPFYTTNQSQTTNSQPTFNSFNDMLKPRN